MSNINSTLYITNPWISGTSQVFFTGNTISNDILNYSGQTIINPYSISANTQLTQGYLNYELTNYATISYVNSAITGLEQTLPNIANVMSDYVTKIQESTDINGLSTILSIELDNLNNQEVNDVQSLSTGLSGEQSTRLSSDNSLSTSINSEISNRLSTDSSIINLIPSITGVTSLSTALSSEISNRLSTDSSIINLIPSITGITSLSIQLNNLNNQEVNDVQSLSTAISGLTQLEYNDIQSLSIQLNTYTPIGYVPERTDGDDDNGTSAFILNNAPNIELYTFNRIGQTGTILIGSNQVDINVVDNDYQYFTDFTVNMNNIQVNALSGITYTNPVVYSGNTLTTLSKVNDLITSSITGITSLSTALSKVNDLITSSITGITSLSTALSSNIKTINTEINLLSFEFNYLNDQEVNDVQSLSTALSSNINTINTEITSLSIGIITAMETNPTIYGDLTGMQWSGYTNNHTNGNGYILPPNLVTMYATQSLSYAQTTGIVSFTRYLTCGFSYLTNVMMYFVQGTTLEVNGRNLFGFAAYSDNKGVPGTLLGEIGSLNTTGTANGYVEFTGLNICLTGCSNSVFYIGVWSNNYGGLHATPTLSVFLGQNTTASDFGTPTGILIYNANAFYTGLGSFSTLSTLNWGSNAIASGAFSAGTYTPCYKIKMR